MDVVLSLQGNLAVTHTIIYCTQQGRRIERGFNAQPTVAENLCVNAKHTYADSCGDDGVMARLQITTWVQQFVR